jgi:hypothetical protein
VDVGSDFQFILLDQLGSVRGWHDASQSSIYSNEVKDTRQEPFIVKAFKGGTLIEGIYKDIKDRVNTLGGQFVTNCYIGFKNGNNSLGIGSLRFKGAALGAWMEFCKTHRADLYKKAIRIKGYTEGKKGKVVFRVPVLTVAEIHPDTDKSALALDKELQEFFAAYFKRTKRDQVEEPAHISDEEIGRSDVGPSEWDDEPVTPLSDSDIPF